MPTVSDVVFFARSSTQSFRARLKLKLGGDGKVIRRPERRLCPIQQNVDRLCLSRGEAITAEKNEIDAPNRSGPRIREQLVMAPSQPAQRIGRMQGGPGVREARGDQCVVGLRPVAMRAIRVEVASENYGKAALGRSSQQLQGLEQLNLWNGFLLQMRADEAELLAPEPRV